MKRAVVAALLVAACGRGSSSSAPPGAPPVSAGPGTVGEATFHSDALGADKRYRIYLPGGYAAGARRYPVIYMLHGLGDDEDGWLDSGKLDRAADQLGLQAIVVMPDGDASFYSNWADPSGECRGNPFNPSEAAARYCVTTPAYEDYVTRDLIAHVDATYRTIAEREARGVGGLSMGGYGALALAMRHRELFAAAASHSGVDALLYGGPFPFEAGKAVLVDDLGKLTERMGPIGGLFLRIFGADLASWRAHDPAQLAASLAPGALAIYLDCGSEDNLGLHNQAQYLHEVLGARGIEHAWYLGPGGHNFDFWSQRIDDSLGWFAKQLAPVSP